MSSMKHSSKHVHKLLNKYSFKSQLWYLISVDFLILKDPEPIQSTSKQIGSSNFKKIEAGYIIGNGITVWQETLVRF